MNKVDLSFLIQTKKIVNQANSFLNHYCFGYLSDDVVKQEKSKGVKQDLVRLQKFAKQVESGKDYIKQVELKVKDEKGNYINVEYIISDPFPKIESMFLQLNIMIEKWMRIAAKQKGVEIQKKNKENLDNLISKEDHRYKNINWIYDVISNIANSYKHTWASRETFETDYYIKALSLFEKNNILYDFFSDIYDLSFSMLKIPIEKNELIEKVINDSIIELNRKIIDDEDRWKELDFFNQNN